MQAFILRLDRGEIRYECYVQQIPGKREDIFIVNFKDSCLIRQFHASKLLFYITRDGELSGRKPGLQEGRESQLKEHLWNAIKEREAIN
jgi:hypothetical protein